MDNIFAIFIQTIATRAREMYISASQNFKQSTKNREIIAVLQKKILSNNNKKRVCLSKQQLLQKN